MLGAVLRIRRRFEDPAKNIDEIMENRSLGILRVPCAVLKLQRRFWDLVLNVKQSKEIHALGNPAVTVQRSRDLEQFFEDPWPNIWKVKRNRALGDHPAAACYFKRLALFQKSAFEHCENQENHAMCGFG